MGDLALIAFYYLLRVGEYTYVKDSDLRRTKQFRVKDVTFWHHNHILPKSLPEHDLLQLCTEATLSISNQKNGKRRQVIHHHTISEAHCPVRALIRRIKHIYNHCPSNASQLIIGTYFAPTLVTPRAVTGRDMNLAIKSAVISLGLISQGIDPKFVSSHSLRAGGAMAMHLNGIAAPTTQLMGRWSSHTFLTYIHNQISAFSDQLAAKMSTPLLFKNIAGPMVGTIQQPAVQPHPRPN